MTDDPRGTRTRSFGASRREGHDASDFYARFTPPTLSDDDHVARPDDFLDQIGTGRCFLGSSVEMTAVPDNSVALVVTSPPYFVGKDYELEVAGGPDDDGGAIPATYLEFLGLLRDVFAECARVLEPGGRIAVNVANLGRKPYRSLSADVISILQDDLGLLLRGEIIWQKAKASGGSCAWGSFARASNPVLRDNTERIVIASKGSFARAIPPKKRARVGLPAASTQANDEFIDVTRDVWEIDSESATRIGHPAPFPVELPRRLIDLYTYSGDVVLDPFLGSGTTMVAAARTGRIGIGFDTDPDYLALAEARIRDEWDRVERVEAALDRPETFDQLSADERQDFYHRRAVDEGRKIDDIAERVLREAGFVVAARARLRGPGLEFPFLATNTAGENWYVDVVGGFTSAKPGLLRIDTVWRLLGRLHAVRATEPEARVLVLTSNVPRTGSEGFKALHSVGPVGLFDALELYHPATELRLRHYARAESPDPVPGFWSESELLAAAKVAEQH